MELITTFLGNPYALILLIVAVFMMGILFSTYKKSGNDEKFRILILESIDQFMQLNSASKLGKQDFTNQLVVFVKAKIVDSELSDAEKNTLLNGKLIDQMVIVFVDTTFEASEKIKESNS